MSLDLTVNYGGLRLRSPIIVGSCPMTANFQSRIAMENAGAGAIVLPSLFEEHIIAWKIKKGSRVSAREERLINHVDIVTQKTLIPGVETYLSIVNRASVQSSIPVIASLNGVSDGDWLDFAGELQATGASAIELNIDLGCAAQYASPREAEDKVVSLARTIGASISVPLFLKLHREFTSVAQLARRLVSGVQGLVLFARDPEIDITLDDCQLKTNWGLSAPGTISPSLRAMMSVYGCCPAMPLAANGGIAQPKDMIKVLLGGADAAMIVSAIYREGPDVIRNMLDGLTQFMESNGLRSLNELQSRRPLEFNSEEDRLSVITGLTANSRTASCPPYEPVIVSDKWGHPIVGS